MAIAWHPLDGTPSPMGPIPSPHFSASFDTPPDPPRPRPDPRFDHFYVSSNPPRAGTKGVLPMVTGPNEYDIPAV
jgi:hypothetical protein